MNKRLIYGIVCIVIAGIIAFAGIPLLTKKTSEKTMVVKAATVIPKGTQITAEMLKTDEVGSYGLSDNTYGKVEDIIGQYAATDIIDSAVILSGNITQSIAQADSIFSDVASGKTAVALSVKSLASGLSDQLQTGDIIRIYYYKESAKSIPELQYVKVLSVTDSKGQKIDITKPVPEGEEKQQASSIIVQATPTQAQVITQLEYEGNIHIALIYRGDIKQADELIKKQDEMLAGGNNNG